jgi:hypothetical protein
MPALLFVVAYVLRTLLPNLGQVTASQLAGPLLIATAVALVLTLLLALRLRDRRKAEVLATLVAVLLTWPAPFIGIFEALSDSGLPSGLALATASLACVVPCALLAAFLLRRPPGGPAVRRLYEGTCVATAYLLVTALWPLRGGVPEATRAPVRLRTLKGDPPLTRPARPPNIYWIVLDAYSRGDILRDTFEYDNEPFLDALRKRGFRIATAASANYATTLPSLASAMNWDHIDPDPTRPIPGKLAYYGPFITMVRGNRTARLLGAMGYHRSVFSSGNYAFSSWDVEETHEPSLGSFDHQVLRATTLGQFSAEWQRRSHHAGVRAILDALPGPPPPADRPRFVFAHVMAPHPPFVMDEAGAYAPSGHYLYSVLDHGLALDFHLGDGWYEDRYVRQLRGVNALVLEALDRILAADPDAVVLLHGDHGSASRRSLDPTTEDVRERYAILHALRIPAAPAAAIAPTFSPVNAMRLVANCYFGAELPMLEDRTYSTNLGPGYSIRPVPDEAVRPEGYTPPE